MKVWMNIELFDSDEDLKKFLPLGLNQDYDLRLQFSPKDLVVIGGCVVVVNHLLVVM